MTTKNQNLLRYGGVFLLFFCLFLLGQIVKVGFFDYDAYYHAKHSALMAATGNIFLVDPWVDYHFLSYAPVDPYWLFHVLTAGLIRIFGTMLGVKIISAITAASIFLCFYIISKKLDLKKSFLFTVLFFISSSSFLFRLLLERPLVISISCSLLGLYFIIKKKYFSLGIISTIYILLYNLAPILLFPVVADLFIQKIYKQKLDLKPLIATLSGLTIGLLLHPHTLNYIILIYSHFIQIFWLKLRGVSLPSGMEIQVYNFTSFIKYNILALVSFVVTLAVYLSLRLDGKKKYILDLLLILSTTWFLLATVIPRAVEYWIPFGWLFIVSLYTHLFPHPKNQSAEKKIFFVILLIFFSFLPLYNLYKYINRENKSIDLKSYEEVNDFLIKNTDQNTRIFYPMWSRFPKFFYGNTHNLYIAAFDPVFTYNYNPEFFWIYYHMVDSGLYCNTQKLCVNSLAPNKNKEAIHLAFKIILKTPIIIIEKNSQSPLLPILVHDKINYEQIFENDIFLVFRLR